MKVLGLHGMGTSARIWESQTSSFRYQLPKEWQWDFVDGEESCDAAPGIDMVYEGPYRTYYTLPDFDAVEDCHEMLDQIIEDEGPFDAVMGFSQGGALAASYLLRAQIENPHKDPPFRLAIFICASLPYAWNASHGVSMASIFSSVGAASKAWKAIVPADDGSSSDCSSSDGSGSDSEDGAADMPAQFASIRRFQPDHDKARIQIPTVHVYGDKDSYLPQSLLLQKLCQASGVSAYQHSAGHELPRTPAVSKAIAAAILEAKSKAEFRM